VDQLVAALAAVGAFPGQEGPVGLAGLVAPARVLGLSVAVALRPEERSPSLTAAVLVLGSSSHPQFRKPVGRSFPISP